MKKSAPPTTQLSGRQIRAARALLDWSGPKLAKESGVSYATLTRAEAIDGVPDRMITANLEKIRLRLWKAGIIFLDGEYHGDGGVGVRLRE